MTNRLPTGCLPPSCHTTTGPAAWPTSRPGPGATGRHLYASLDAEWLRITGCQRRVARARGWDVALVDAADLDDVLRAVGYVTTGRRDPARQAGAHQVEAHQVEAHQVDQADELLGRLVTIGRDDQLAARVVLQRLLPGLRSIDRRRRVPQGAAWVCTPEHDDLIATAWTVIRTYAVERRPHHIAAGLLQEIEYRTFRLPFRRTARFVPTDAARVDAARVEASVVESELEPRCEAALTVTRLFELARRAGVDESGLVLLDRLARGASADDLAVELSVTARTVRNRRDAAVRALRALAEVG